MRDPETPEEWQEAVDAAHAALCIDACRQYGLITGGPKVNVDRCAEIVDRGRARGVTPSPDAFDRFIQEHNGAAGRR